jgi:hypothetical protein
MSKEIIIKSRVERNPDIIVECVRKDTRLVVYENEAGNMLHVYECKAGDMFGRGRVHNRLRSVRFEDVLSIEYIG